MTITADKMANVMQTTYSGVVQHDVVPRHVALYNMLLQVLQQCSLYIPAHLVHSGTLCTHLAPTVHTSTLKGYICTLCAHQHPSYTPSHFVHTSTLWGYICTLCAHQHPSYTPSHFVHTSTLWGYICTLCAHQHPSYTPSHFVHTSILWGYICTLCAHQHPSYTPPHFVHTTTLCTHLAPIVHISALWGYICTLCTHQHPSYTPPYCAHHILCHQHTVSKKNFSYTITNIYDHYYRSKSSIKNWSLLQSHST